MRETLARARGVLQSGRLPSGVLGMMALVLAVELLVVHLSLDISRPEYWLWYASGRSAAHDVAKAEILCLGTSQTSHGVVPQVLEERLGRKAYNLAMCSSPPQADYYLLKRVLDSGERPKAVVLDLHPHLMAVGYWGSIRFFPNLLSVGECLDLGWAARDPDFAADALLAKALPSVLGRFDIRNAVKATLAGQSCSLRPITLDSLWNREVNKGAMVLPPKSTTPAPLTRTDCEWDLPQSWAPNPINLRYVHRLLDLAARHDITVFLLIPPLDARLQYLRETKGLTASYAFFAMKLQLSHRNLVVVDGVHSGYPFPVFTDAMHLTRPGAVALTRDLAEAMRPHLERRMSAAGRWVTLPPYSEPSTRAEVVELTRSSRDSLPWKAVR